MLEGSLLYSQPALPCLSDLIEKHFFVWQVTAILYANPGWDVASGGQLRIWLPPGASPHASSQSDSAVQPQQLQHNQLNDACQQGRLSTATTPASLQAGEGVAAQQHAAEQQKAQPSACSNDTARTDASFPQPQQAGQDNSHSWNATSLENVSMQHAQQPDAASLHNQHDSTATVGILDSFRDFNHGEPGPTE